MDRSRPGTRDPVADAINAAAAFYNLACSFFSTVPAGLEESARFAYARRGPLTAAVTNLTLSLELYLKGIALGTGTRAERTHDLLKLFDALPEKMKSSIEREYNERAGRLAPNANTAIEIVITPTDRPPTKGELEAAGWKDLGTDIRSVLAAEKDAFRTWRYFHEAGKPGETFFLRVDYGRLGQIVNSLQAHLKGVNA